MKRFLKLISVAAVALVATTTLNAQHVVESAPETDAVYRLPLEKGLSVVATSLSAVEYGSGQHTNQANFCAWQLTASKPSKVYAAREGKVVATTDTSVTILHPEGLISSYERVGGVCVKEGDQVDRKSVIAQTTNKNRVVMTLYYNTPNPQFGTESVNGAYQSIKHYVNPIFATRGKCKVQLASDQAYTVRVRNWCWPWE